MEGKIVRWLQCARAFGVLISLSFIVGSGSHAQESPRSVKGEVGAQLKLRKTMQTRELAGKVVEGEERVVAPGDSLWRVLIEEKGLPEKRFGRYLAIIGALNPQIKTLDVLHVGDTLFIPIKPDEIIGIQLPAATPPSRMLASQARSGAKVYRVKRGDYLFKILQEQLNLAEKKEIESAFDQVRELNPGKRNWNLLSIGEMLRLPSPPPVEKASRQSPPQTPDPQLAVGDDPRRLPARENLPLLERVMAALGNEVQRTGEEVLLLNEGTVRIDRNAYPVISNPQLEQRVILDPDNNIPPSLRSRLGQQTSAASVVPVAKESSLQETVSQLLPRLGFQTLPSDRPVVLRDQGAGLEVKGNWMVIAPQESNKQQEMIIINLTDHSRQTPEYLKNYLSLKGMSLKDILLPSTRIPSAVLTADHKPREGQGRPITWPRQKSELIDALLQAYQISYSRDRWLSVTLKEGIRLDTKADRWFEFEGRRFAIFFRQPGEDVKKALAEKENTRSVELDLTASTAREVLGDLLRGLGENQVYREHRFPATSGARNDKVQLAFSGYFLPKRSLFLTDQEVPEGLQNFFFDKNLQIVYFR